MGNIAYNVVITVLGYFAQDDALTAGLPAIPERFGLIDDSPERWTRFVERIEELKNTSDDNTKYKVIFFGRHGEGFHNVALAKYKRPAWIQYWSKLTGDGEIVWGPDPELTEIGIGQAVTANEAWKTELPFGMPLPEKIYTSPLTRALKTCEVTFDGVLPAHKRRAVVVENCREQNGLRTSDKRRTRSYIERTFPLFDAEPSLTEDDILWDEHARETKEQLNERARKVIDHIFENDKETFISITAHRGVIHSFLECLCRAPYALPTGGVLPVIVKAVFSPWERSYL